MAKRKASENPSEPPASFEESLGELQSIVAELEDGSLGLETSLARFERGIGLLRTCYQVLESAEAKVEILTRFNGEELPSVAPFENSATLDQSRDRTGSTMIPELTSESIVVTTIPPEDSSKSSLF